MALVRPNWIVSTALAVFIVGLAAVIAIELWERAPAPPPSVTGLGPSTGPGAETLPAMSGPLLAFDDAGLRSVRASVYVPAYASIRAMSGRSRIALATTLTVHNTSSVNPVILDKIDYFDSNGGLVRSFVTRPVALKPYGTLEIFVPADENAAGVGANFIVEWSAEGQMTPPVIEAVMIGVAGTTSYSFVSRGQVLREER